MLCLCTTLRQDGLTAQLLVVRGERLAGCSQHARLLSRNGSASLRIAAILRRVWACWSARPGLEWGADAPGRRVQGWCRSLIRSGEPSRAGHPLAGAAFRPLPEALAMAWT